VNNKIKLKKIIKTKNKKNKAIKGITKN